MPYTRLSMKFQKMISLKTHPFEKFLIMKTCNTMCSNLTLVILNNPNLGAISLAKGILQFLIFSNLLQVHKYNRFIIFYYQSQLTHLLYLQLAPTNTSLLISKCTNIIEIPYNHSTKLTPVYLAAIQFIVHLCCNVPGNK